jgi:hypothetical protein
VAIKKRNVKADKKQLILFITDCPIFLILNLKKKHFILKNLKIKKILKDFEILKCFFNLKKKEEEVDSKMLTFLLIQSRVDDYRGKSWTRER